LIRAGHAAELIRATSCSSATAIGARARARSKCADQRRRHSRRTSGNECRSRRYWLAAAGELTAAAGAEAIGAEAAVSLADPPLDSALRLQPAANDMDATSAVTTTIRVAQFMALLPLG
jgi:hypothetical protein